MEVIIEAIAKASGQLKGLDGIALRRHVSQVLGEVQRLTTSIQAKAREETQRSEMAADAERLVDMLVRTGTSAGKALEKHKDKISSTLKSVDIQKLALGMRMLSDWMTNPNAQSEEQAKVLMEELENKLGPIIGYDPERAHEQRMEEIREEAKARMSEVLGAKKFKVKLPEMKVRKLPDNDEDDE